LSITWNHFRITMSKLKGYFTTQTINQPKPVQQAKTGDIVTIQCFVLKKDFNLIVWYKQLLGKKPQPIAMSYYRNDVHFLKDVATYYCGVIKLTTLFFSSGTFLMITSKYSVQPDLKPVHLSDNITLQCTVEPNYFNSFTKDHMVMDQFSKITTLTIKQVKISFFLTLSLIARVEKHHNLNTIVNATTVNDLSRPTVFISEKNYTGTSKKGMFFLYIIFFFYLNIKVKTTCF
uniref:Ig-like domain-containing protein n=1 Tax=Cyprinus carpio TaxID=7962 RepID=A0A8C1WVZ6_CYPCA